MAEESSWPYESVGIIADENQRITRNRSCDKCGSVASEENPLLADPLSRKLLCYPCTRKRAYWLVAGNEKGGRLIAADKRGRS